MGPALPVTGSSSFPLAGKAHGTSERLVLAWLGSAQPGGCGKAERAAKVTAQILSRRARLAILGPFPGTYSSKPGSVSEFCF